MADNLDTDRRRQASVTSRVRDTFQRINFYRVFCCLTCGRGWLGRDLRKNQVGLYVCLDCAKEVKDVTDSPLGKAFLDIVLPDWRKQ